MESPPKIQNSIQTANKTCGKIASLLMKYYQTTEQLESRKYDSDEDIFAIENTIRSKGELKNLLIKLQQKLEFEEVTLLYSVLLIDRYLSAESAVLTSGNATLIVCVAISLAYKYLEDEIYSNQVISKIIGLENKDLALLEMYFLKLIDYKLFFHDSKFKILSKLITTEI